MKNLFIYHGIHKETSLANRNLVLDLKIVEAETYYAFLAFCFHEIGFNVLLKHNFRYFAFETKNLEQVLQLPRVRIVRKPPSKSAFYFFTDGVPTKISESAISTYQIRFDVQNRSDPNEPHFVLPFQMSPDQYFSGRYKSVYSLRNSKRNIRIFFSGNTDHTEYGSDFIRKKFGLMNRVSIIEKVIEHFNDAELSVVTKKSHWEEIDTRDFNQIVICKWKWSRIQSSHLDIRIPNELWLEVLSRCEFYLATPGVRMPLCFNVVEAMSVGAIPIIEYPEYFDPPLEHKKNCLQFSGDQDLLRQTKEALIMEEDEIRKIRNQVLEYYDNYLAPQSVVKNLLGNSSKKNDLFISATGLSY